MNKLILGIICFALGQTMIWYQTNGQFKWKWFADHPILLALMFGGFISYTYILGTKYIVEHFDGLLWPGRLIGFGIGAICFAILTYIYMGEGITTKTAISLILAISLVMVQIFWK